MPAVQASDLAAALSDGRELARQQPRVPKAKELIESIKIIGQDRLTASDQAIYEALLAWVRDKGIADSAHTIPLSSLKTYAEITRTDDLVAMLHRLGTTYVKYDVRDRKWRRRGTLPLVLAEVAENEKTGDVEVRFQIPESVREIMIESRQYAHLELAAFPKFSSRYSARLYQRLALRAGYTNETRISWEIEPKKLAESLGFKIGKSFRYADFRRNALEPALTDISLYVTRFRVTCTPVKEDVGRGLPAVVRLRFDFEDTAFTPPLASRQAVPFSSTIADEINRLMKMEVRIDGVMPTLIPSLSMLSRLVTHLHARGRPSNLDDSARALRIFESWLAAIDEAVECKRSGALRADVREPIGDVDICGEYLLDLIKENGFEAAFVAWAEAVEMTGRHMRRLKPTEPMTPAPSSAESRRDRAVRRMMEDAKDQMETLPPTIRFSYSGHVRSLCDPEVSPWHRIVDEHPIGRTLAAALRAVGKMNDKPRQQRQTMINMLRALSEYDLDKLRSISGAVLAAERSSAPA